MTADLPASSELPATPCPACGDVHGSPGAREAHLESCIDSGYDEYSLDLAQTIEECIETATSLVTQADDKFTDPALLWTGGKDSTTLLHLIRETIGLEDLTVYFIDHYQHFEETYEYVEEHSEAWQFEVRTVGYEPAKEYVPDTPPYQGAPTQEWEEGEPIPWMPTERLDVGGRDVVNRLIDSPESRVPAREKAEIHDGSGSVPLQIGTIIGDTLLKTIPLQRIARDHDVLLTGVRKWETAADRRAEKGSRFRERYFSPRSEPEHYRCHPLLDWREAMTYAYLQHPERNIEMHPLYEKGYRSIGAVPETDVPESGSEERGGRSAQKEGAMAFLREQGYM